MHETYNEKKITNATAQTREKKLKLYMLGIIKLCIIIIKLWMLGEGAGDKVKWLAYWNDTLT